MERLEPVPHLHCALALGPRGPAGRQARRHAGTDMTHPYALVQHAGGGRLRNGGLQQQLPRRDGVAVEVVVDLDGRGGEREV